MKRTTFVVIAALAAALPTLGQDLLPEERTFSAERLRPAMDREGIIDVETGRVQPHLSYDAALWLWYAHNPLVLYRERDDGSVSRARALVGPRVGGTITGQIALYDTVELGLSLPFIAFQGQGAADPTDPIASLDATALQPVGVGDLRISPKFGLLRSEDHLLDVAFIPTITLPTALGLNTLLGSTPEYMGEKFITLTPEIVAGRFFKHGRVAANLGVRLRPSNSFLGLIVTNEVTFRLGGAYRLHKTAKIPLELQATLGGQAAVGGAPNLNGAPLELLTLGVYDIDPRIRVGLGGGFGLTAGYGTPDFRVLANASWSPRAPRGPPRPADGDKDGVADEIDECPDEPEDADGFEDQDGCPDADNDGDGIADDADRCPLEAEDADDHEDADGCPDPDNDGDGVPDTEDRCPLEAGPSAQGGCPIPDADNDGLPDDADQCVNEPEDRDGFEDEDGCPDPDNDGDGVLDAADQCPDGLEDMDEFQDDDGCPDPDNDNDGIADAKDKCPLEPETINGNQDTDGCPDEGETLVIVTKSKIEILDKVYFATGKATIRQRSYNLLRQVASILQANPQVTKVRVEGHTDSQGNDAYNKSLSDRRAKAVRSFLIKRGVDEARLEAQGFGEERPVADNGTAEGREQNRRVEFQIVELNGKPVDGTTEVKSDEIE